MSKLFMSKSAQYNLQYIICIMAILIFYYLSVKAESIKNPLKAWLAEGVFMAVPVILTTGIIFGLFGIRLSSMGSVIISDLSIAFMMAVIIYVFCIDKLRLKDCVTLFLLFTMIVDIPIRINIFNTSYYLSYRNPICYLLVFVFLLTVCKIRLKHLSGELFKIWYGYIVAVITFYLTNVFFMDFVRQLGYKQDNPVSKLILWGFAVLVLTITTLSICYALTKWFSEYFNEINEMGIMYPNIERYFIRITAGIFLGAGVIYTVVKVVNAGQIAKVSQPIQDIAYEIGTDKAYNSMSELYYTVSLSFYDMSQILDHTLIVVSMAGLLLQLFFLTQLFRVAHLRESLSFAEEENKSLTVYAEDLEQNINDIREIKHDIKNIFYAMGQFVEKSDDMEMKKFYTENINPYAEEAIKKNDLYQRLAPIKNEQFKAFIFYKASQAIESGIDTEISIKIEMDKKIRINFTDLIRILGIFLDNAIEEGSLIENPYLMIKITHTLDGETYVIKNKVGTETKINGIKAGCSTKGDSRGKGLAIAENILSKYENILHNSYFDGENFVQSIVIYA